MAGLWGKLFALRVSAIRRLNRDDVMQARA
jgi:hypothetical protein